MADRFTQDGVVYEDLGNGQVRVVGYEDAPQQSFTVGTPDPGARYEAPMREAQLQKLRQDIASAPVERRKEQAQLRKAEAEAAATEREGSAGSPTQRADAIQAYSVSQQLRDVAANLRKQYQSDIKNGGWDRIAAGAIGAFPTPENRSFNDAGNQARALIKTALGFTGGESNTAQESETNYGPFLPQAGDYNQQIENKIAALEDLASRAERRSITILGGVPNMDGSIQPETRSKSRDNQNQSMAAPPAITSADSGGPPLDGNGRVIHDFSGGGGSPMLSGGGSQVSPEDMASADQLSQQLGALIRSGASKQDVEQALYGAGYDPTQVQGLDEVIRFRDENPQYQGGFNVQVDPRQTKLSGVDALRNSVAQSPLGTAAISAADAVTGGYLDNLTSNPELTRVGMDALSRQNPTSSLLGSIGGGALAAGGLEMGAARAGIRGAPLLADAAYGALAGSGSADEGSRLTGAIGGAGFGAAGGIAGRRLIAPAINSFATPIAQKIGSAPKGLTGGDRMVFDAAGKSGIEETRNILREAQDLGLPMTLADTGTPMRSLAGAAARRSPQVGQVAEDTFSARNRGQIDRFGQAVQRDLGPVTNVPEQSEKMMEAAKALAAPFYEKAYAKSVPDTPEIQSLLGTPFGRQALGRANTIAANERRASSELGFALDESGNPVVNPFPSKEVAEHMAARLELNDAQSAYKAARLQDSPSMAQAKERVENARSALRAADNALKAAPKQGERASIPAYTQQSLDYVKRGMDDVLEKYRNPITNRLQLDDAGRAENKVLRGLLSENDKLNPAFAEARAAYSGPVSARDALMRGQDATRLSPDELAMQIANQTPEHIEQMRLGFRSQLLENARNLRSASNPYDAASTLGTEAAQNRLGMMYPDYEGAKRLLRQAELERGMARTSNKIIGNSDTAERRLADEAFSSSNLPNLAIDAGLMAAGQAPLATIGKALGGAGLKDAITLGFGKRATERANEIGKSVFNPDPQKSLASLNDLVSRDDAYRIYINNLPTRRAAGIFGASIAPAAYSAIAQ